MLPLSVFDRVIVDDGITPAALADLRQVEVATVSSEAASGD
jgi:hypothetical protein